MKQFMARLKAGDVVQAEVLEATGEKYFIINFNGELLRIANRSREKLSQGQKISLVVTAINPFSFQLQTKNRPGFDRRV